MKNYIFYTAEGYTQEPDNRDIENCQIVGWAKGNTPTGAFKSLKRENKYLQKTSFSKVICQELMHSKKFYFSLKV